MKRSLYVILTSMLVLSLAMIGASWAAETSDEKKLDKETAEINKTAGMTGGSAMVVNRIEKEFNVTADRINALRDKGLGYGEIAIVFSLAGKLPGGITDANVAEVTSMRSGPPVRGWGEIAKRIGVKLGPAVSAVTKVNMETRHDMKTEKAERMERYPEGHGAEHGEMSGHGGMGAGGMSHGKGY